MSWAMWPSVGKGMSGMGGSSLAPSAIWVWYAGPGPSGALCCVWGAFWGGAAWAGFHAKSFGGPALAIVACALCVTFACATDHASIKSLDSYSTFLVLSLTFGHHSSLVQ